MWDRMFVPFSPTVTHTLDEIPFRPLTGREDLLSPYVRPRKHLEQRPKTQVCRLKGRRTSVKTKRKVRDHPDPTHLSPFSLLFQG